MTDIGNTPAADSWLEAKLACPTCGGELSGAGQGRHCESCGARYGSGPDVIDLLPEAFRSDADWNGRLEECDLWYDTLIERPVNAAKLLLSDYRPFARILRGIHGDVLDVGGGNGIPRAFLGPACRYVSLEPSLAWLGGGWAPVSEFIPALSHPPTFVRGVGEHMPFRDNSFDAVLSFWSLNHVADPDRAVAEAARVVRPGGLVLLVQEDQEPEVREMGTIGFWRGRLVWGIRTVLQKARLALERQPWPLQSDHVRITDAQAARWSGSGLRVAGRRWIGGYLTFELRKVG
jgi:SAM-dependent methyltransferase